MKVIKAFIFLMCIFSIVYAQPTAGKMEEIPAIEKLLKAAEYSYERKGGGEYQITLQFDDERTQLVRITPFTSDLTGSQQLDIWSTVAFYEKPIADSIAHDMMLESGERYLGRFQCFPSNNEFLLVYSAIFYGELNKDILKILISEVAAVADIYELKLTGKDDH